MVFFLQSFTKIYTALQTITYKRYRNFKNIYKNNKVNTNTTPCQHLLSARLKVNEGKKTKKKTMKMNKKQ